MSLSIVDQMKCLQWLWERRAQSWNGIDWLAWTLCRELSVRYDDILEWNNAHERYDCDGETIPIFKFFDRFQDRFLRLEYVGEYIDTCTIVDAEAVRDEMIRLDALLDGDEKWPRTWR